MSKQKTNPIRWVWVIPLAVLIASVSGCASHKAADVEPVKTKIITDIVTSENSESVMVTIKGDRLRNYMVMKQASPRGLVLYFPETTLQNAKPPAIPPNIQYIRSIESKEIVEGQTTKTRVFIALTMDRVYDLIPFEGGLNISFPKVSVPLKASPQQGELPAKDAPQATTLKAVTAKSLEHSVAVNVEADGTIFNYKAFTLEDPARIVFDMFDIKSPFNGQQKLDVTSQWIKRIRHFGYPDKVRLVLDTESAYLEKYTASPTQNGLMIHVGEVPATKRAAD
jgi:type IV pilus assembly protein PilQ